MPAIANPISRLIDGSCVGGVGDGCLGGSNGAGFGWQDMTILKLGYEWQGDKDMLWRVGYSMGDQPIPDSEMLFNILAPAVIEEHVTFGFTRALDAESSINFAAMYALSNAVSGLNTFDPAQTIKNEMDQFEFALTYSRGL